MSPRTPSSELAQQLGALADETRLRVAALLARRPHYGEELSDFLGLSPATVSHHVKRLREAGLVSGTRETRHVLLELDRSALALLGELLRDADGFADHVGVPAEEDLSRRILAEWLDEQGLVREFPVARRARGIVVRWIALQLESDRLYPERELRFALLSCARDPDAAREELLRQGWLKKIGTVYRRVGEADSA